MADSVVPLDTINPGELCRWTGDDGKEYVGTVAGVLGAEGYNCVEATGRAHRHISREKVSRR